MNSIFYITLGGFTASNVPKRSTKVIQLSYMSKAKSDYPYARSAESAI